MSEQTVGESILDISQARAVIEYVVNQEGSVLQSAEVDFVETRPGTGTSIGWDTQIIHEGTPSQVYLVVTDAALESHADRLAQVTTHDGVFYVWRFPHDPLLPGLPLAADIPSASQMLEEWVGDIARIDIVTYRPLRRAVLRISGDTGTVFVKVLLPRKTGAAMTRHQLVAQIPIPAPQVLHTTSTGLIVLSQVPGKSLAEALHRNTSGPISCVDLDPRGIVAMLDALPHDVVKLPAQIPWADRMAEFGAEHAHAAQGVPQGVDAQWAHLASAVRELNRGLDLGPIQPTHGDLNAANLRIPLAGENRWGIIDLDTIGPGHRVDDLACLTAHLAALPAFDEGNYQSVPKILAGFVQYFDTIVDPVALRVRAAGVLVSLAVGERDERRLSAWAQVARNFLTQAERLA